MASRLPWLVALSRLLWPVAAAACYAKVLAIDTVTVDRCRRTLAFVKVGGTAVNDELIRQGLARVFSRYCDRPMCEQWERLEDEARTAVHAERNSTVRVSEK